MSGVLRIDTDVGLLTNRRMSLELGVGLSVLTGRRLSMRWSDEIGGSPGERPAGGAWELQRGTDRPTLPDLWEVPETVVPDAEWDEVWEPTRPLVLDWGHYMLCVYLAEPDREGSPGQREFANGRTRFVHVPDTDDRVVHISGRPLSFYSYFFHASGAIRKRIVDAIATVKPRAPYRELGACVARDVGEFNVAHVRRTDLVAGIRSYAGVSPNRICAGLMETLPTDEPLLIATEASPTSTLFDPIRSAFKELVFINDLLLSDYRSAFDRLPWAEDNALGVVTQEVAIAARSFTGTLGSTFTALIQRERLRRNPDEQFTYTVDYTGSGAVFRRGRFAEIHEGRYTWNRIGMNMHPANLSWFREWPEAITSPDDLDEAEPV
jgi:hypothetical protein